MTKITVPKVFELAQVAATNAFKELQPYIDGMMRFTNNIISILDNGVGFNDNIDCDVKTITVIHNTPLIVATRKTPIMVLVGKQVPITNALQTFTWRNSDTKQITVTAKFENTPTSEIQLTVALIYS